MKIRKSINSATGYWADDINAENNKRVLQTLAKSLYDNFDSSEIDGVTIYVDDVVRNTTTNGAYKINIYLDPSDYRLEKKIDIISTADGRGKFILRVFDNNLNEIEEIKIPISGCKQAVIDKINELVAGINNSQGVESSMKIRRNRVTANKRRAVKSACGKRSIKSATQGGDMLSVVELNRQAYINQWEREYEGEPSTSWDNIFDNVLDEFTLYCGDEASAEQDEQGNYGDTLEEQYYDGRIDSDDIDAAFSSWIFWLDISDYDV